MDAPETVLVVEDQPDLLKGIALLLEQEGYHALTAADGLEGLETLQSQRVDLILADIAMPGMNGYQLYERVRENPMWVSIPFIFLTARVMDSDIRYGKVLGVDDYLTKPFRPQDLLAVVKGKLRRAQQLAQLSIQTEQDLRRHPFSVGRLRIDPDQHQAWLDGRLLELSPKQFKLLKYLAQRAGKVLPAQELIQVTHGLETDFKEAGTLLRPLIRTLRRKLNYPVGEAGCIQNVRGIGYRLTAPVD
jgi:DNA-binding response OmpR family regulator